MGKRKPCGLMLDDAEIRNRIATNHYFEFIFNVAINMFEWKNLPDTIDARFLELTIHNNGSILVFKDEAMGIIALPMAGGGALDIYRIPTTRNAYAVTGYHNTLNSENSVIIFNNYLHTSSIPSIVFYSDKIADIQRSIDVNVNAQKTTAIIKCEEGQRLTMENALNKAFENNIAIFSTKDLDLSGISSLDLKANFVAPQLQVLKKQMLNEALSLFGVSSSNTEKKERLISDEVQSNLELVEAQRDVMLNSRREAAEKINKMFGTNIEVKFRLEKSLQPEIMEGDENE